MQHLFLIALATLTTAIEHNDTTLQSVSLDEVVVVAPTKETVRLSRQPLSSATLSSEQMTTLSVNSLADISRHVASLNIPAYGSRLTSSLYIRGIGSRTGDPAVGIYYDNVPLVDKSTYNIHFYQLDHADVLRGPQGTLYGVNSEGGLIRLYSKNPLTHQGTTLSVNTHLNLGNSDEYTRRQPAETTVETATYQRLSDNFAFSLAGFLSSRRGYLTNTHLDHPADDGKEGGARLKLVWTPDRRSSLQLSADWQYTDQSAFPYGIYTYDNDRWTPPSTTFDNTYRRNMLTVALHASRQLGSVNALPRATLSSTTSFQRLDDRMNMDQDYLAADLMRLIQTQRMNAVTQEIIMKTLGGSRWRHTTGLFLSHEWLKTDGPVYFGDDMNEMIKQSMGIPQPMMSRLALTDNSVPASFSTPRLNVALYHETNISLTPRLTATIGLRYDLLHTSIHYDTQARFSIGMTGRQDTPANQYSSILCGNTSDTHSQLLPKIALTYITDSQGSNVYASWSKGFRAGGYNLQMFADIYQQEQRTLGAQMMQLMQGSLTIHHDDDYLSAVAQTISYAPEESWSYEAGCHQYLFNGSLRADAAVYYMTIRNQQLSVMAGDFGRMMVNAGKAQSYGVELSCRGSLLADRLAWTAAYSRTHSEFENVGQNTATSSDTENDGKKYKTPFIPVSNLSLSADWTIPIATKTAQRWFNLRKITLGSTLSANGPLYWDVDNNYRQPFHALLDARMSLVFSRIAIAVHAQNLTSTRYNTFLISSSADRQQRTFSQRGLPRRLSITLTCDL